MREPGLLVQLPKVDAEKQGWPWNEEVSLSVYGEYSNWPKITIVTPTYNQGPFIEETIRSVLLQNYPNLEYIIIDGKSTDNTVEIIRKYEPWIKYWVSETDDGQCHAINKGLAKSSGDIFNWLNSDDLLEKNALCSIADSFKNNPDLDILRGRILYFDTQQKYGSNYISQKTSLETLIAELPSHVPQASTYIKMQLTNENFVGVFNEKLNFVFDLEWMLRYYVQFERDRIIEDDRILSRYRLHENSKTMSQNDRFLKETISVYRDLYYKIEPTKQVGNVLTEMAEKKDIVLSFKVNHLSAVIRSSYLFLLFLAELVYYNQIKTISVSNLLKTINPNEFSEKEKRRLFKIKLSTSFFAGNIIGGLRRAKQLLTKW